jgi:deoxyadenosine/deoxycytidine kinase
MPIFSIEGNIGSGKSTLLEKIKRASPEILFVPEPVDEWNTFVDSSTGETILEKYYKDQGRWAFTFQMMAFITRVSQLKKFLNRDSIVVMERSVFTDREIFAKMLRDSGKIHVIEYAIYLKWFDELVGGLQIDGVVYVNTTPEVCEQRIAKRSRKGESNISFDYLEECGRYHDEWLKDHPCKLVLNGDVMEPSEMVTESLTFFLLQSLKRSVSHS